MIGSLAPHYITRIEQLLSLTLPDAYVRFAAEQELPPLVYMTAEDCPQLHGFNAAQIVTVNENLREQALGMLAWKEQYFSVGEREDGAVFYIDTLHKDPLCPVFIMEDGEPQGKPVARGFAAWAAAQLAELRARDAACAGWQKAQKLPWWRRLG